MAGVAVSAATYAIDRPYSYRVPQGLSPRIRIGQRVMVPFGRGNRRVEGVVLALRQEPLQPNLKSVAALLDEEPGISPEGVKLALWMRERYFCTVYDAVKAMLPAGLYFSLKDSCRLAEGVDWEQAYETAGQSAHARRVLDLIRAGQNEIGLLRDAFGESDPGPALKIGRAHV